VRAAFPSDVIGPVVAGQADLVDLTRFHLLHLADVAARVVFHVCLSGTVTAFAAVDGRRRSWILLLRVRGTFQRVALFGVTLQAFRCPDVAAPGCWGCRRLLGRSLCRSRFGTGGLRRGLRRRSEGNRAGSTNRDCRSENARGCQTLTVMHGHSPHTKPGRARSRTGSPSSFLCYRYDSGAPEPARAVPVMGVSVRVPKFSKLKELVTAVAEPVAPAV